MKTQTFFRSAALLFALFYLPIETLPAITCRSEPAGDSLTSCLQPWIETAYSELDQLERDYFDHTDPLRMHLQDVKNTLVDPRNRIAVYSGVSGSSSLLVVPAKSDEEPDEIRTGGSDTQE